MTHDGENYRLIHHKPERAPSGEMLYCCSFEELPGCLGQGSTALEAEQQTRAILPMMLNALREVGAAIPAPSEGPTDSDRLSWLGDLGRRNHLGLATIFYPEPKGSAEYRLCGVPTAYRRFGAGSTLRDAIDAAMSRHDLGGP